MTTGPFTNLFDAAMLGVSTKEGTMTGTGRLDPFARTRIIVDVVIEPEGRSRQRLYIDRMTLNEIQDRVPWSWIGAGHRAIISFVEEEGPEEVSGEDEPKYDTGIEA